MTETASSGVHSSSHASLKVPIVRPASTCVPHGTSSTESRCRSTDRASWDSRRRSSWTTAEVADALSRKDFCCFARSLASGTIGVDSGTRPSSSPMTRVRSTRRSGRSEPSVSTARAASVSSARPTDGRPRTAASAPANRVASTTDAVDASRFSPRSARATRTNHDGTTSSSGVTKRWWYHPGERTPAP